MKKILFFLLMTICSYAQRNIPYPIVFVHGLKSNDGAWIGNLRYLKTSGMNVDIDESRHWNGGAGRGSRLDFCLNADNDDSKSILNRRDGGGGFYGDVRAFSNSIDGNNDVFVVNFDVEGCKNSNESAIVKQGFALGLAIKNILEVTKSNKVILVGHSMGGLAIREYITNREDWVNQYGNHCVAHVVTIGTPHGGSNMNILGLIYSEAIRDLRTSYYTGAQGVYLFGGVENPASVAPNIFTNYQNVDINCNGVIGERIVGLNQKPLPADITFISLVGNSAFLSDIVVTEFSQNLMNFQKPQSPYNIFQINATHWEERNFTLEILNAIEYASTYGQVEIPLNRTFLGAFVNKFENLYNMSDSYKFFVFKGGKLKLTSKNPFGFHNIQVYNRDKDEHVIPYINGDYREYTLATGGNYVLIFTSKFFYRGVQLYSFTTEYCQFPDAPLITADKTTICQGEQTELVATSGFDSYNWFLDGTDFQKGPMKINADKAGNYTMQALGCGTNLFASNSINVNVIPLPDKPTIIVTSEGLKSSSITGNQWYLDGQAIEGANQQVLATYGSGNYSVKATNLGCSNESAPFVITSTEDNNLQTKLYPNPTNGVINLILSQGKQELSIVDFSGKVLYNKEILIDNSPYRLDCSFLNSGEYILKIETTTNVRTFKFFIL